jgi:hypothetical protein
MDWLMYTVRVRSVPRLSRLLPGLWHLHLKQENHLAASYHLLSRSFAVDRSSDVVAVQSLVEAVADAAVVGKQLEFELEKHKSLERLVAVETVIVSSIDLRAVDDERSLKLESHSGLVKRMSSRT